MLDTGFRVRFTGSIGKGLVRVMFTFGLGLGLGLG